MQVLHEPALDSQAVTHSLENQERKIGVEIVRSADLTSRFFHGPRPTHYFPVSDENETWARRVARSNPMTAHGNPLRGTPAFANKNYAEILSILRAAGPRGVHRADLLYKHYLSQCGARIHVLNTEYGYQIASVSLPESEWINGIRTKYVLRSEPLDSQAFNDSRDWYEIKFGKPRPVLPSQNLGGLPLFGTSTAP